VSAQRLWSALSFGILLIGAALIVQSGVLSWLLVLLAVSSLFNALIKKRWRFVPHPLLWAAGMSWAIMNEDINGFAMFLALCGASFILWRVMAMLSPKPSRPGPGRVPPPRPRSDPPGGPVLDAEATVKSND
jgi:predicted phage tail protein